MSWNFPRGASSFLLTFRAGASYAALPCNLALAR